VFSASEKNNGAYSRALVPRCLVHDAVTEEAIAAIAERQHKARAIYDIATNLKTLEAIFARVATPDQRRVRAEMQRAYDGIRTTRATDDVAESLFKERMIAFFQRAIEPHLDNIRAADEQERIALKWFNFNPRITIVFDDCSTDLAKLRSCASVLEQIFQGRHYFCTTIMALHNDSIVLPAMRSNLSMSIFTDQQTARQWITRATNGFVGEKKAKLVKYADRILVGERPNTKMLYLTDNPFLIEIPAHEDFSAVNRAIRDFCATIEKKNRGGVEPWMRNLV
jgi:hypothetical protein